MVHFQWKLTNTTDTILGYACREATATYRGRDYKAYFTTGLPFKAAPWKFYGLPGVILKVFSTDAYLSIEAVSLKIESLLQPIANPFEGEKTYSLEAYLKIHAAELKSNREKIIRINALEDNPLYYTFKRRAIYIEDIFDEKGDLQYTERPK